MIAFVVILLIHQSSQDYIRSDELILNENLEIGSEIINLNNLHKFNPNLQFKIVNDTSLVNYIHLEYLNSDTTLLILKQKLNFDDLCDSSIQQIEARTMSSSIVTCSHTIKIIAINQNNFIEIPIQIRKINFIKKQKIKIIFNTNNLNLNLTSIQNHFLIEKPAIQSSQESTDLQDKLVYQIESNSELIEARLERQMSGKYLNLSVSFVDEKSLIQAYDFSVEMRLKLEAFLHPNISHLYSLESNSSQSLYLRVSELKKLNLQPLDFAKSLYSIVIENKYVAINDVILEPRLKLSNNTDSDIVFSLLQNEAISGHFPFYVDANTGFIRLKSQLWTEDDDYLNKNVNKNYLFGLKATYKRLLTNSSKSNYYYDYMIPAFTKIQISIRREKMDSAMVRAQIASPFISKYEILNKESPNQTFIYYITDPIHIGSQLVHYSVQFAKAIDWNLTNVHWVYSNEADFGYAFNLSCMQIASQSELRDGHIYRTELKYVERTRNSLGLRVLNQVNIEFRVDFDPLLFEQSEYNISLYQSDLVEQKIVQFKLRERIGSKFGKQSVNSVVFRLAESGDSDQFDLDFRTGDLRVKQVLAKSAYNLEILAVNSDIQKTARVKCRISVDCSRVDKPKARFVFSVFEDSLARTQIAKFQSICTNSDYSHFLEPTLTIRLCSKYDQFNCKNFHIQTKNDFIKNLFKIDESTGYLVNRINFTIGKFLNLIKLDYAHVYSDLSDIFESSRLSLLLNAKIKFPQGLSFTYPIQIGVQNKPAIGNFSPKLSLVEIDSNMSQPVCLYNYSLAASASMVSRFVRVNEKMAHFEPEFTFAHCKANFYIDNGGCLSLKHTRLARICHTVNQTGLILNAGVYNLQFKLCFYDNNKVSCSELYNQSIQIPFDVYNTSKIVLTQALQTDDQVQTLDQNLTQLLARPNFRVYLAVIVAVVVLVALVTVLFLIVLFSGARNDLQSLGKKALVIKNDMNFKNLEINTDTRSQASANTPESSSNSTTATNSTKMTKTDEEEEVKIQVLDDYVDMSKQFKQINFGYENKNFSYSGSFRSVGSSYESGDETNRKIDNDQGLYSVKNASIQFQNQPDILSPKKDTDFYACVPEHKHTESATLPAYNCLLVNNAAQANDVLQSAPKTSSLKKLKKDLAVKRAIYSTVNDAKVHNAISIKTQNDLGTQLSYDASGSFSFLNGNNDMLFSPNDMFASVV
ncbi:hypothetical protein BpHYR1_015059 [Brachionus plicatilis]|uniref:Uncharacterized protein n=1 Tax=Brachionus plicatilis TaxID=10195 RepID=A0A3M7SMU4_BRAPC|nr:hypothetical protein BpHYR1_015059 [Brachionus plicatilis]